MKRFRFPLEHLRRLRRQQQRLAEAEQLRCRAQLEAAVAALASLEDQLARLASSACRPGRGNEFLAHRALEESLIRLIFEQRTEVARARAKWEAAREQYRRANLELEKLESLRTRAWTEYRECLELARQKELDEIVMRKWSHPDSFTRKHPTLEETGT